MDLATVPIKQIKLNQDNPRRISKEKYNTLKKSIEDFPQMLTLRPLVLDENYVVLGGNMRLRALKELGYKEVPVVFAKDLTDEQKREFIIKDNLPFGEWDYDILANSWDANELAIWGMDLPADFIKESDEQDAEPQIDKAEELNEKWKVKKGDVWAVGGHRLLCGDTTLSTDIALIMKQDKAQIVFTDPPYGVGIAEKNRFLNTFQKAGRCLTDITDDNVSPTDLKKSLLPAFINIKELIMGDDCTVFVTAPQGGELGMMMMMMREAGLPVRHVLIWKKNSPTFSMGRLDYDYQHEPILLTWGKKHKKPMQGQHRTSVWEIDKPRSNSLHPTMKPIELIQNALLNNSDAGDVCFDGYCGSGSTIVACQNTGRICRAIEISPAYCAVILERMQTAFPELEIKREG